MENKFACKAFGGAARFASFAIAAFSLSSLAIAASPVEWENLDADHHLAGRMASSGYLRGKVVCIDYRDYGDKGGVEAMRRMESIWQAFKMKPFVLVGSHRGSAGAEKIKRIAEGLGLTFPLYKDADIVRTQEQKENEPQRIGFMYVVSGTGKILYCGMDDRRASGVIASSLMSMRSPQTPKQWKHYIDFDIDVLPGRAYVEIEEFRKAFPKEAAEYDDVRAKFSEDKDVRRVAKLERISVLAKDYDFKDPAARRLNVGKLEKAIETFSDLKTSENPLVAQEAKNCIADLTWTCAVLKKPGGR